MTVTVTWKVSPTGGLRAAMGRIARDTALRGEYTGVEILYELRSGLGACRLTTP